MNLDHLTRLAEGATNTSVAQPKWWNAMKDFHTAANPQMVLALLAVVKAAQYANAKFDAMEADGDLLNTEIDALASLRAALAALTSPTTSTEQKAP